MLLNLSGIRYLSSSMLVRLINLQKTEVVQSEGQLVLCCLTPVMRDTFRVSRLDRLFEIFDDEAAALESFWECGSGLAPRTGRAGRNLPTSLEKRRRPRGAGA